MTLGKLSRFENLFDSTIIERGRDYENMGYVTQLTTQSVATDSSNFSSKTKQYTAQVIGSRRYRVKALLTDLPDKDMVIESLYCSCPYEDSCKHMVAMLLKIRKLQSEGQLQAEEQLQAINTVANADNHISSHSSSMDSGMDNGRVNDMVSDEGIDAKVDIIDSDKILQSLDDKALRNFVQHCFLNHPELIDDLVIWHSQYKVNHKTKQDSTTPQSINDCADQSTHKPMQNSTENNINYEYDPKVLKSLYRQIASILDLDEHQMYSYEPDISDNLYQFDRLVNQFDAQPQYQLSAVIRWIDNILTLYDDNPESDLQALMDEGLAKLGEVLFNIDENENGIGYAPSWSDDFILYQTHMPTTLIQEVREKIDYWQYEDAIQEISVDANIERLSFDLYIAKQDWLGAINILNQNIEQAKIKNYDEYDLQNLTILKIAVLNHLHSTPKLAVYAKTLEPVEQLLKDYEHLPKIRRILVSKLIQDGKLDDAIALINQGIDIAKAQGHHGTVDGWQAQLVEVAQHALTEDALQTQKYNKPKLLTVIRDNSKALTFEHGRVDDYYYKQWKDTYSANEWQDIIGAKQAELAHSLQQSREASRLNQSALSALIQIYVLENQSEKLMTLLKTHPNIAYIKQYQDELICTDAGWLIDYYKLYWQQRIEQVSNRGHYRELAQDIERMLEALPEGKKVWQPMVSAWQSRFSTKPRKPALLDELSKIRWED